MNYTRPQSFFPADNRRSDNVDNSDVQSNNLSERNEPETEFFGV